MANQKRDFKGIWIDREVWLSKDMTLQEKVFYVEIFSLDNEDGCFANNEYFSDFFGVSKVRVSEVINSLVRKGYISSVINSEEGNKRILKTLANFSLRPYKTKVEDPIKDSFIHSNTVNNTIDNSFITELPLEGSVAQKKSSKSKNVSTAKPENESYRQIIDFWLKEFHIGFTFNATSGKKVISIISKFKTLLKNEGRAVSDESVVNAFKYMCLHLPDFYKDKDLSMLESKFNEIILEIKNKNDGKPTGKQSIRATTAAKFSS